MTDIIETHLHGDYVIKVLYDIDPMNPRDFDNLGTILYTSNRYLLGDKRVSEEEIEEILNTDGVLYLPVYAYIHGDVVLNTTGFSCPWDSAQCGIIYVTAEKLIEEYGQDENREVTAREVLKAEIETFSAYLSGQVFGFHVEVGGEHIDSCYGYYSTEEAVAAAKESIA